VYRLALFWIAFAVLAPPTQAQDRPVNGVVWSPPESVERATRDLRAMASDGVEAVRTPLMLDERLLTLADTIGIQWYQDLPLAYLSAQALADSLDFARLQLDQWLSVAQRHPSMRHVGLARLSDTSDPAACAVLQQLATVVQNQGPPGSRTYYVTPFTTADACASSVDDVLLDVRAVARPLQRLRAWRAAHPNGSAGLGALGTWIYADTLRGLNVPHSPEAQARYLERHLGHALADTLQPAPTAVFVYRWQDVPDRSSDPYGRSHGLYTAEGAARPAADVMTGFYTGSQTVFAFPGGQRPEHPTPWLMLAAWGLIGLLAVVYFRGPRFQNMVARYFGGHNFYQESVREGREVLTGSMVTLMIGVLASVAMLGIVTARSFQDVPAVLWAVQALPDSLAPTAARLMQEAWQAGAVLAAVYALSLLLWMGALVGVGRYGTSISSGQALMLVGAPQWPLLLVMVAALTVSSFEPEVGRTVVLWLWTAVGVLLVWITGRILVDVVAVMRVPALITLATALVSPLFMAGWVMLFLIVRHDVPVTFITHLLTRT
jgi:hypothetical protein